MCLYSVLYTLCSSPLIGPSWPRVRCDWLVYRVAPPPGLVRERDGHDSVMQTPEIKDEMDLDGIRGILLCFKHEYQDKNLNE